MGIAECIGQGWFNIFDIKQNIFGIFFYFQLALARKPMTIFPGLSYPFPCLS